MIHRREIPILFCQLLNLNDTGHRFEKYTESERRRQRESFWIPVVKTCKICRMCYATSALFALDDFWPILAKGSNAALKKRHPKRSEGGTLNLSKG